MDALITDALAEATRGHYHWSDPGMADFEKGWEEFAVGQRVEVRTSHGWNLGTIVETPVENDRAIVVRCDEHISNGASHDGHGVTVMVMHNTRRGIWSTLRTAPLQPAAIRRARDDITPQPWPRQG